MQDGVLSVTGLILRYVHSAGCGQLEHSYRYARIEMGIGRRHEDEVNVYANAVRSW